jgi:hypothetical protein
MDCKHGHEENSCTTCHVQRRLDNLIAENEMRAADARAHV